MFRKSPDNSNQRESTSRLGRTLGLCTKNPPSRAKAGTNLLCTYDGGGQKLPPWDAVPSPAAQHRPTPRNAAHFSLFLDIVKYTKLTLPSAWPSPQRAARQTRESQSKAQVRRRRVSYSQPRREETQKTQTEQVPLSKYPPRPRAYVRSFFPHSSYLPFSPSPTLCNRK